MILRLPVIMALAGLLALERPPAAPPPEGSAPPSALLPAVFSPALPEDLTEQAQQALAQDAWRRELRFLEAADPGTLFRATRILQADIDRGLWSSAALFSLGAQLFHLSFTADLGLGGGDQPHLVRVHRGRRGGPDETSCAHCHWRGGPAGAGDAINNAYLDGDGDTPSSALPRNPMPLHGAGLVEILAAEMSAELVAVRDRLVALARLRQEVGRGELRAKGVPFGFLTAHPDGEVDTHEVTGVDPDLVIKPFGWKGTFATLRQAAEDELLVHHGMQPESVVASAAAAERVGPHGPPDPDGDGIRDEITEGQVTALTVYLALQEMPQIDLPRSDLIPITEWAVGRRSFETLGCSACHVASLPLDKTIYRLPGRNGGPDLELDLARAAAEPRVMPSIDGGGFKIDLFSDLKRHDMGPGLAEPRADRGVARSQFLTRPLWGIARSRPYLHDARAPTLEDAILLHDGEARPARDRFAALTEPERASLRVFLTSLTRARRMVAP